ncbi:MULTISPECIES: DUF427 domain-containing protein [Burkholderia]|uniref:DUF427 domain-containing protein n=1 Tax=Burkholderia savannae TaxID=1637837 RepID=A0ABR5TGJ0_9BURK|nr:MULTISPECIES: DUF427 domain-containing protein [Burkholderia]AOJ69813.1 hypothetical protein WS78_14360 [Burkholderia savannae]AOJ81774.1 hypothetical protein WS86_14925 [Burkholderia savannae]AOK47943.1 hypothetical protein WT60_14600 [Burkholderia sp. MSMB617WGS]KGR97085.1 hypothetical protein X946_4681 [Burkholderia sp. ABCPW 111]KVG41350.1 hypothetical protein WS77_01100 [Burkholderia sp. MSMB0265]
MSDAAGHRIEIEPNRHRVRVIHRGITYADSLAAYTLRESGLPDVQYLPRGDVNMSRLAPSDRVTRCERKGPATYFHLHTEDGVIENAAWSYEEPPEIADAIRHYVAFDAACVDRIDVTS